MAIVTGTEEPIRRLAADILGEPEFARWRPVESPHSLDWLIDKLRWIVSFLNGTADVSLAVYLVFWGTLIALLLLMVAHAVWAIRAAQAATHAGSALLPTAAAVDFAAQADAFAQQGRFLDAAHCLHLACLEGLLRRGVLQLSRSDPNRTLRRRLQESALPPAEIDELCALVDRMETSWFRNRHEDSSLYDSWRVMHARFREGSAG